MISSHLLPALLVLVHAALIIGALVWLRRYYVRRRSLRHPGIVVQGTVVGLETDDLRWLNEYPIVRFPGPQGQWYTLRGSEKCRAGRYRKGQQVTVRYPAPAPQDFIILHGLDLLLP
ncbi:hypothetical protein KBK19_14635 [Microvirga sp. STR05]|uniref:DUF3592 domain-containing protein n=1 Tax=Hymenobacter duratus TaxID=2771356 RepID=A0ABR8JHF6_9BACT|nr:DUF3592 domain-containing protein [Hymenobacter duratus]MBD2716273.1 hypothetical protein [Hymenobacter duratus]MBR7951189.1 hypothetical protein [Microvirga sp. STR05]